MWYLSLTVMGAARDREIWSMNISRHPQNIPAGAVNGVERVVVRKLNVFLMRQFRNESFSIFFFILGTFFLSFLLGWS